METKHTKGPWVIHYGSAGPEIHPTDDKEGSVVIADVTTESVGNEQAEINAQLLATSPELLEACEGAVGVIRKYLVLLEEVNDVGAQRYAENWMDNIEEIMSKATNPPPEGQL